MQPIRAAILLTTLGFVLASCLQMAIDETPPEAPSGLTATPGNAMVELDWLANGESDLLRHNIYQALAGAEPSKVGEAQPGDPSFTATGLVNGSEYVFEIDAEDTSGNLSERSDPVTATPIDDGLDVQPPSVVSSTPSDGDTDVAVNANLTVTFSEAMNQAATEAALSVIPNIDCTVSWDASGTILSCNPDADLAADTSYSATVDTGATDLAGNALELPFAFSFTTGTTALANCRFDDDTTPFNGCIFAN